MIKGRRTKMMCKLATYLTFDYSSRQTLNNTVGPKTKKKSFRHSYLPIFALKSILLALQLINICLRCSMFTPLFLFKKKNLICFVFLQTMFNSWTEWKKAQFYNFVSFVWLTGVCLLLISK